MPVVKLVNMRIGVDFGTTRVVVAAVDRGNFPLVYFETPDGQMRDWFPPVVAAKGSERVYGWEAVAVQDEKDWTLLRSPKRLLRTAGPKTKVRVGDQTIPVQQLMAEMMAALQIQLLEHSNLGVEANENLEVMLPGQRQQQSAFSYRRSSPCGWLYRAWVDE